MAISSWIKGRRYRINGSDLLALAQARIEINLPFSYMFFNYGGGETAEFNGFLEFNQGNGEFNWQVYVNDEDNDTIAEHLESHIPLYIEFTYDYNPNDYTVITPTDNLKAIANLVDNRSLVAIWKESTSTWYNLPHPSEYRGISTTVVDSARNQYGQVIAQVVKSDIAKIELKWKFLTVQQFSDIAKLFEQNLGGSFIVPVSFFNITTGLFEGDLTKEPTSPSDAPNDNPVRLFYPSDRQVDFAHIKLDANGKPIGYSDVSLNLIDTGLKYGEQV